MKAARNSGDAGPRAPRGPPQRQLTIMMVSVCVAFVCLRLPYTISYALNEYTKKQGKERSEAEDLPYVMATRITDVIATTNYVVNFFLYGLCGSYFRQQVRAAFRCRRGGRGIWASGGRRQFGSTSLGNSVRTSDINVRLSVVSETGHLNAYRRDLPPIKASPEASFG